MDDLYIQKVLEGDREAFRFIIKKYKDMSYSLAMSVVNDEFAAQEIVQISFVKAYSALAGFKGKSKFSTWLYRIVINEAFQVVKKQGKNAVVYGELPENAAPEVDEFSSKIAEDEKRYYIQETLKKLPSNESLALRLFYLEENSIEDIIEMTGWSCSNVKVILHRARINMKQHLKEYFNMDKQAFKS
jgi:RNA polymerase sigma factor (sigma-70 family)